MQKHLALPQAFAELGIDVPFLEALARIGFVEPSEIQKQLIPVALSGRDILGQARTGTGKTAAFGLPILQRIDPAGRLQAICLVPTRELAVQVTGELQRFAAGSPLHLVTVYGGQRIATQLHSLGRKPHLVVGTPGRVMDFLQRGAMDFSHIRFVVLDEVDRMLDIGFRDDIRTILGRIHSPHQTIFVSATINEEIRRLSMRYMNDPAEINVSQDKLTVDEVDQSYVTVENQDKFRALRLYLEHENPPITIIFCNTKHAARKLAKKLFEAGVNAKEIHGDLVQEKRERVMAKFRKHQLRVLVATDLAARGIDVSSITHIINYDIPKDPEVYVHRVGRTARMGARGVAVTFVNREEGKELTTVEMLINRQLPQLTIPGFAASVEPVQREAAPVAPMFSRYQQSPSETPSPDRPAGTPVRKTLGGRFRPARSRRR